ncbi:MAG: hypothetical protein J7D60_05345 [Prosthecochloris sp.]|nr:hypothetical protein [Prosthecochloris sp.]
MAEELKKPEGVRSPENKAPEPAAERHTENIGDIPMLMENVGHLIDSTIESVTGMIASATNVTGQIIDNVNVTVQSDTVKGIMKNLGSVSENLTQGITSTSEQLKDSIALFGKVLGSITESISSTVTSEPVKNLFETVSNGLGQIINSLPTQNIQACCDHPKAVQIPYSHKKPEAAAPEASVQEKPAPAPVQSKPAEQSAQPDPVTESKKTEQTPSVKPAEAPEKQAPKETMPPATSGKPQTYTTLESDTPATASKNTREDNNRQQEKQPYRKGKTDPSRKGTFPKSKGKRR